MASKTYYAYGNDGSNKNYRGKLVITETNNITSNTSSVVMKFYLYRCDGYTGSNHMYSTHNALKVTFDGDVIFDSSNVCAINLTGTSESNPFLVYSTTKSVSHNSSGEKTIPFSFVYTQSQSSNLKRMSISGSHICTLIPRTSKISSCTSSVELDGTNNINLVLTRYSSKFTHTVVMTLGIKSKTVTDVGTSMSYTVPKDWCNTLPNSNNGTITIVVKTMYGSQLIGSVKTTCTAIVPSSYKPTGTITLNRINGTVPVDWGVYVQNKSKVQVVVHTSGGGYGAGIKSIRYEVGPFIATSTTANYITDYLYKSGTQAVKVTITDTRNRSCVITDSFTVVAYSKPLINLKQFFRKEISESLQNIFVKTNVSYSTCNGNNKLSIVGYLKKSSEKNYPTAGSPIVNNNSAGTGIGSSNDLYSYNVKVVVTDQFNEIVTYGVVPSAKFAMHFRKGGNGVAFGKTSELADSFECNFTARFMKQIFIDNGKPIYFKDTSGNLHNMMTIAESNNMHIANNDCTGALFIGNMGNGDTYLHGRQMFFRTRAKTGEDGNEMRLFREDNTGKGRTILRCDVNGGAYLGSNTFRFNTGFFTNTITASDAKIKTDPKPLDFAKPFLMALRPYDYLMKKQDGSNGVRRKMGFYAQEVYAVLKSLGIDLAIAQASIINEDGTESEYHGEEINDSKLSWGLNYNEFIAPLVKVVQEHEKEIQKLKEDRSGSVTT